MYSKGQDEGLGLSDNQVSVGLNLYPVQPYLPGLLGGFWGYAESAYEAWSTAGRLRNGI